MQTTQNTEAAGAHVGIMDFNHIFKPILPKEISDSVFTLAGTIFPVITAGDSTHYNAMTASGGGMGLLFKKPTTWCLLQSTRYTLQLIEKMQTYTISYFPRAYKKQIRFLGSKSGRNSRKMEEVNLTKVQTPSGNISFEEARLILECKLTQISTPGIDDFYAPEAIQYVKELYQSPQEYRKYVFGEITHVWTRKS